MAKGKINMDEEEFKAQIANFAQRIAPSLTQALMTDAGVRSVDLAFDVASFENREVRIEAILKV